MKIKVGDKLIDSKEQSIMIIVDNKEKEVLKELGRNKYPDTTLLIFTSQEISLVSHMSNTDTKFCCHPEDMSVEEIREFMRKIPEEEKE